MRKFRDPVLETIANRVLKEYDPALLNGEPKPIPIEAIAKKKYGIELEYQHIRNDGRILGLTIFKSGFHGIYDMDKREYILVDFDRGTIILDATLLEMESDGRMRFTLAHELAHWILHKEQQRQYGDVATHLSSGDSDNHEEHEADVLASLLLMPKGRLKVAFFRLGQGLGRAEKIAKMAEIFEVSKQAMSIRLKGCGLI